MIENAIVKNGEVYVLETSEDTGSICTTCAFEKSCMSADFTIMLCYDLFNGKFEDHFVKKNIKLKEV